MTSRSTSPNTHLTRLAPAALLIASAAFTACGSSSSTPSDSGVHEDADAGEVIHDDAAEPDTGRRDTGLRDTGPRDTGPADTGPTEDNNNSFAEAVDIPVGSGVGATGAIDPAGDLDYYKFTAPGDTFMLISTRALNNTNRVDTVITLYDSAMAKVAENDDALNGGSTDSEIIFHVPAAGGSYFVMVQEYSSWAMGQTPVGMPEFTYRVTALPLNDATNGVVIDPEHGNDVMSAVPVEFGRISSIVVGTFTDPADVDVYRLTVRGTGVVLFSADLFAPGPDGQGSTSPAGLVWISDVTGSTITARIDNSIGINSLSPPLDPGDYLIWFSHTGMPLGANDFYGMKPDVGNENPPEMGDPANDTPMGAEALSQADIGNNRRGGYILADLPENDVDYFSFEVLPTEHVSVSCSAATSGSGVHDMVAEVRDRNDVSLAMQAEMPPDIAYIPDVTVTSTGTYYLRLSRGVQDPEVVSHFVRCAVRTFIP